MPANLDFWCRYLEGHSRNQLPFHQSASGHRHRARGSETRSLDRDLVLDVLGVSRRHDLDPKSIYFTAHVLLLSVLCQESEILTGFEATLSDPSSVTCLPIRARVARDVTKLDLIRGLHSQLNECCRYATDLAQIREAMGSGDDEGALVSTSFGYRTQGSPEPSAQHAFELALFALHVTAGAEDARLELRYREDYFTAEQIRYALSLYETILRSFCSTLQSPFTFNDYLSKEELADIVYEFNDSLAEWEPSRLLHHDFERVARRSPERIALIFGERTLTYGELNERANQTARLLIESGEIGAGVNVGIIAERNPFAIIAMLAILKAGCTYVPIDPTYPHERHAYIIANAGIRVVLADKPYAHVHETGASILLMDDPRIAEMPGGDVVSPARSGDLAYIIYTSGSTGRPKGVMIEHRSIVNLVDCINRRYEISGDDRFILLSSFCFDLSVYDIFGSLSAGASLALVASEQVADPFALANIIEKERITFWNSVPSTMVLLVEALGSLEETCRLDSLKTVFLSGDWIPVDLPGSIRRFFPSAKVMSLGGATEGTVWSNHFPIDRVLEHWKSIPYGYPLTNNFFYVLDEHGQPVPRDVVGELCIGGIGVARGYISDPEKTARAFKENPFTRELGGRLYRTGDLGRLSLHGYLEILGRKDNQVKVRGYRIELGEIEQALESHEIVQHAVAAAVELDKTRGKELVAYVVTKGDGPLDRSALREHLKTLLPAYMVPVFYVKIESLPLSENGKVDRKRLPRPASVAGEARGPSSEVERKVYQICQGLLGPADLSMTSRLAELGLNSLSAIRLIAAIDKTFGVGISVAHLISLDSLDQLARHIEARLSSAARADEERAAAIPQDTASSRLPLTGLQMSYFLGETDLFPLGNSIAHVYKEFRIADAACDELDRAVNALIAAHPMLRAYIEPQGEWRLLEDVPEYHARVIDCTGLTQAEKDAELERQRQAIKENGLDTSTWPLFDFTVLRFGDGDALLHCRIDLVLLDGLSITTFFTQLDRLLMAPSSEVATVHATYADYRAAWRRFTSEQRYLDAKKYWGAKIDSLPDAPRLPMIKRLRDARRSSLTSKRVNVSATDWSRLEQTAASYNVSPGMLVYTVFAHVLARWSLDSRFTVNVLYYNREPFVDRVTDILGNFSSTLLFETELRKGETFLECALRLQRQQTHELQHAIYDGVDVLNERNRIRKSVEPGMPVVFTSLLGMEEAKSAGAITELSMGVQTPQVYLDCLVREVEGQLVILWSVQEDLFYPNLFDDMLPAMRQALERLAGGSARWQEPLRVTLPPRHETVLRAVKGQASDEDVGIPESNAEFTGRRDRQDTPSTDVERALHRIWCELLGVPNITVDDNFFDLGGHSLSAVRFVSRVKSLYKVNLPLSVLSDDGTIRAIARVIEGSVKASENRNLLLLQPAGRKEPLYCVHAVGGHALNYRELAQLLRGTQRPFYAIQAHGVEDGERAIGSIPEMAERYLEMLRRVQPRGPYFLAGWSFGGIVAYEMARQLELRGEPVASVIMIDTWAPLFHAMPSASEGEMFRLFVQDLEASLQQGELLPRSMLASDHETRLSLLLRSLQALGLIGRDQSADAIDSFFRVYAANMRAMARYTISPVRSRVVLIQAKTHPKSGFEHYKVRPRDALGWRAFIDPEVIEVKGDHYSIITGEHVNELAEVLAKVLPMDPTRDLSPAIQHSSLVG